MSKFLKALEQAEREHALRKQARQEERISTELKGPVTETLAEESPPEATRGGKPPPSDAEVVKRPVKEKIPTVESEPRDKFARSGVDEHLVSLREPASFEAEQYRTLRYVVENVHKEASLHVVAVTSPGVGDGKTTTAINLAGTLAQAPEARVLLVDADLRRPSLLECLGVGSSNGPGLVDAILRPALNLNNIEWSLPAFNLSILPPGRSAATPYEVLKSPRLEELLADARRRYDYIVLDTAPIVPVPDCRVIGKWVDAFIVVVAADKTPRKLLEEALNVLDPEKVLGIIFNSDDRSLSKYYGYHYTKDSANGSASGLSWSKKKVADLLYGAGSLRSRVKQACNLPW